jgi:hypothetical protein
MRTEIEIDSIGIHSSIIDKLKINPNSVSINFTENLLFINIIDKFDTSDEDEFCSFDITKQQAKVLGNALITYSELME